MADRQGLVIHEPPDPTNPHRPDVERDPPPAPCVACGAHHGGVNAEILCLRSTVRTLRARNANQIKMANAEIARLLGCLREFEPARKETSP